MKGEATMTKNKRITMRIASLAMAMMLVFGTAGMTPLNAGYELENPPIVITPFDFNYRPALPGG
jgi:hypothetical protein